MSAAAEHVLAPCCAHRPRRQTIGIILLLLAGSGALDFRHPSLSLTGGLGPPEGVWFCPQRNALQQWSCVTLAIVTIGMNTEEVRLVRSEDLRAFKKMTMPKDPKVSVSPLALLSADAFDRPRCRGEALCSKDALGFAPPTMPAQEADGLRTPRPQAHSLASWPVPHQGDPGAVPGAVPEPTKPSRDEEKPRGQDLGRGKARLRPGNKAAESPSTAMNFMQLRSFRAETLFWHTTGSLRGRSGWEPSMTERTGRRLCGKSSRRPSPRRPERCPTSSRFF